MAVTTAHQPERRLFTDPDARRFYLIPDGVELPPGEVQLSSMTGQIKRAVDAAALPPYAATQQEAKAWLKAQASEAVDRAQLGISGLLEAWKRGREPPPWSQAGKRQRAEAQPGLRLLAALSGFDAVALAEDPAQVKDAAAELVARLDAFLVRAKAAQTEANREALEQEGRRFVETVRGHGIDVPEATAHAISSLVQGLSSGAFTDEARDAARRLETSFARIDTWADVAKHGLAAMSERLRRAAEATRPPEGDDDEE